MKPIVICEDCKEEVFNQEHYLPSDSLERYCEECENWYNDFGQMLRSPDEYSSSSEGYTPFGDE